MVCWNGGIEHSKMVWIRGRGRKFMEPEEGVDPEGAELKSLQSIFS